MRMVNLGAQQVKFEKRTVKGGDPQYGSVMRSYGQYCPVSKGAELLGDRWTLLIVRELLFGPLGFNEIERGLPGISRSVLSEPWAS